MSQVSTAGGYLGKVGGTSGLRHAFCTKVSKERESSIDDVRMIVTSTGDGKRKAISNRKPSRISRKFVEKMVYQVDGLLK